MKKTLLFFWDSLESGTATSILIGFGVAVRIIVLLLLSSLPLVSDALSYHKMSLQLLSGQAFPPYWPPALPYFLASFYLFLGASEFISKASMLAFYIIFSILMFLLTREISTIRAGNLTILFFSIFPAFVYHSVEPLTPLPTATCLIAVAYLLVLLKKNFRWMYLIFLGLVLAFLVLTRASSIFLALLIPIYLAVKTKNLVRAFIPLLIAVAIIFVWIVKVNKMTGRWIFVNEANSFNFFVGNNIYTPLYKTWWFGSHGVGDPEVPAGYREMLSEIRSAPSDLQDKLFFQAAFNHILSRPDLFLIRTINRFRAYFAFDTFTGSALISDYSLNKYLGISVLFLDAVFYCSIMLASVRSLFDQYLMEHQLENIVLFFLVAIGYAFPYWISFSHPTYHFPIVPLFCIPALIFVENWLVAKQNHPPISLLPVGGKRNIFLLASLFFLYIQFEWILVMGTKI